MSQSNFIFVAWQSNILALWNELCGQVKILRTKDLQRSNAAD
jgi:hypothetical protein